MRRACLVTTVLLGLAAAARADAEPKAVQIIFDREQRPLQFAAEELAAALRSQGREVSLIRPSDPPSDAAAHRIVIQIDGSAGLGPQAYRVSIRDRNAWTVTGGDAVGAMYGGLQAAEAVRLGGGLEGIGEAAGKPAIAKRGVKFNVPLDARTPSYDDTGDAAQNNIAVMWEFEFWREVLDDMARHRYNVLTLWSCHPYPSIVKLPKYPDVALDDVCRLTVRPTHQTHREWTGINIQDPANLEVAKRMTIDEKIDFWRRVMQHAADRGIEVYLFHWNIFVHGAAGKYGITDDQTNEETIAYLRECVKQTLLTYPHLSGIGVTAGEHMQKRDDAYSKERWLWRTYGQGVMDAKREQPDRHVRFIFRRHQSGLDAICRAFTDFDDTFETSFKYARAHMYSSPEIPFFDSDYRADVERNGVRCWLNVRNDDIFCFRWGDPDYVREFLEHMPHDVMAGYYVGSDGYVWGREFTSKTPSTPRQLEIRKHWWRFMLWGRLGYDPTLDRGHWERVLAGRLPGADAAKLYEAWTAASKIIPQVNRFHWRDWDFMWSPEGCLDHGSGFHTVQDFIRVKPMDKSGILSIPDFVTAKLAEREPDAITPLEAAESLERFADTGLTLAGQLRRQSEEDAASRELAETLSDIEAMCLLGRYYSAKIRGATALETFRRTKEPSDRQRAVDELTKAAAHWKAYATAATSLYRPQLLARTRRLDWEALAVDVQRDIAIARGR
jgi:hypothetical protein